MLLQVPAPPQPAAGPEGRRRRLLVLGAIGLTILLISASVASLTVALPGIARATDASSTQLTWMVDAYVVALASLLLPLGGLGDRRGRRLLLLAGLAGFAGASVGAALASSADALIVWRALAGVASAAMMPATLAIITTVFPPDERGQAIGVWTALAGVGGVFGLLATGALLELADWPIVFWMSAALAAVTLIVAAAVIPASQTHEQGGADPVGAVLSAVGFALLVVGVVEGGHLGWTDPVTLAAGGAGLAMLALFVLWELRVARPLLDVRLFRHRSFAAGSLSISVQFFVNFGLLFATLQWLQEIKGFGTLQAAVALLPLAIGLLGLGPVAAPLAERHGQRRIGALGLGVTALGTAGLALLGTDTDYLVYAGILTVLGCGMGLAGPVATAWITGTLPADEQGVASAVNDTTREVGGALGIAAMGSLITSGFRDGLDGVTGPATDSLAAALQAAERVPGGAALAEQAQQAWMNGHAAAMTVATILLALATVAIAIAGPRREGSAAAMGREARTDAREGLDTRPSAPSAPTRA